MRLYLQSTWHMVGAQYMVVVTGHWCCPGSETRGPFWEVETMCLHLRRLYFMMSGSRPRSQLCTGEVIFNLFPKDAILIQVVIGIHSNFFSS